MVGSAEQGEQMENYNRLTPAELARKPRSSSSGMSRRGLFQAAAVMAPPLLGAFASSSGAEEPGTGAKPAPWGRANSWSSIRKALHQQAARIKVFDTHEHIFH